MASAWSRKIARRSGGRRGCGLTDGPGPACDLLQRLHHFVLIWETLLRRLIQLDQGAPKHTLDLLEALGLGIGLHERYDRRQIDARALQRFRVPQPGLT